ncbi:MAG TPA: TetR/AcrR family transcriptional regulator [Sulfuricella sp.]|nr:TetR/AcrR family transcriptional regulator [Sulfuricella sp.]
MPPATPSEKFTVTGADATERILAAAKDLFAESGFNAVSMSAIAELAGVSKANIFHHFKSKNELYLAVLKTACSESLPQMDRLGNGSGALVERLRDFSLSHLANILRDEKVSRLIQRDLLKNGPQRGKELAEQVFGQNFARLVDILRSGQKKGELREEIDPAMLATLLIGANVFYFQSREVLRHFPDVGFTDTPERYSAMLVDMLLYGILPPDKK